MASINSDLQQLLESTLVDDVCPPVNVIEIDSATPLDEAFAVLIDNNVQSAPVRTGENKYSGFLDIRDLVSYIVLIGNKEGRDSFAIADLVAAGVGSVLANATITYLSKRNPYKPLPVGSTMAEVVAKLSSGVKRVPIIDADGKVVSICSGSSVVRFLNQHLDDLPDDVRAAAVKDVFPSATMKVKTVNVNEPMIAAFKIMDDNKITGLALTNDEGDIVGVISGKDLKQFVGSPSYELLHAPVGEVLAGIRAEAIDISAPAISTTHTSTVESVIQKLAATKIHRLYVVASATSMKPVGVVTVTDVLRGLCGSDE